MKCAQYPLKRAREIGIDEEKIARLLKVVKELNKQNALAVE